MWGFLHAGTLLRTGATGPPATESPCVKRRAEAAAVHVLQVFDVRSRASALADGEQSAMER